jgi:hypothetical protein
LRSNDGGASFAFAEDSGCDHDLHALFGGGGRLFAAGDGGTILSAPHTGDQK